MLKYLNPLNLMTMHFINHDRAAFDARFAKANRRFNIMFGIVATFMAIIFAVIFAWYGFLIYIAVAYSDQVKQEGVRGVAERVWCGKTPNCSLPMGEQK